MKTTYKYIFAGLFASLVIHVNAQSNTENDSTLNRQIMLERDFNPTLQDAAKINTLPAIHEPVVKPANVEFETQQPGVSFASFPIGDTGPGNIRTDISYNKKRGYLSFSAGNYANLEGKAGYRIVDTENDILDFLARYSSTNGKIKYASPYNDRKDGKAKYNNILLAGRFSHVFDPFIWFINGSFENTGFNYYGDPVDYINLDMDTKQSVNIIEAETGIRSKEKDEIHYEGIFRYNHFSTKYGPSSINKDGIDGNILSGTFNMDVPVESDKSVGIHAGILNQSFGNVDFVSDKNSAFHSLTKINAIPHFKIDDGEILLSLGLNLSYAIDNKNKLLLAPDIHFSYKFAGNTAFYASATGKINENTYLQIFRENRYVSPYRKVNYSRTLIDGKLGIKSGIVEGIEFDIFGGYKQTKDEHLYIPGNTDSWGNVSTPIYAKLGTGHFGGLIKTNLIPMTELSAVLTGYFYNINAEEITVYDIEGSVARLQNLNSPWNLPTFTIELKADIKPIENFIFSANYRLSSGRKAFLDGQEISMKNINELNLRAEYKFIDWVSVFVGVNNLLNQKYDTWFGYTHQGINALGGINLTF